MGSWKSMFPVSSEFNKLVAYTHRSVIKAAIYLGDEIVYPLENEELIVLDGSVTVSEEAIRRRVSVSLTDPTGALTPRRAGDLLTPFGSELRLWRGVRLRTSGVDELVPLGVFRFSDVNLDDSGATFQYRIDAYDRARTVQRAAFLSDYVVAAGTNYADAIKAVLRSRVPWLEFDFAPTSMTTPQLVFQTGWDPWKQAQQMATAIGCELFFDATGICVLRAVPDYSTIDHVIAYEDGADGTALNFTKRSTDEDVFNHVIVTGETTDNATPVRGEWYDSDPSSPTYIFGVYGDVPKFHIDQRITSAAQANAAAAAIGNQLIGAQEQAYGNVVVHPALDVGDVALIRRERAGIQSRYIYTKLTIPLTVGRAMNVSFRLRRYSEGA